MTLINKTRTIKEPKRFTRLSMLGAVAYVLLCLTISVLLTTKPATAFDGLSYLTEEYYPFNYTERGQLKGISVDLLHLIWKELDVPPQPIQVMPWARAYERAKVVTSTVLFSMARTPGRDHMFRWSGPIKVVRFVLIAKRNDHIVLPNLSEIEGYRIGTLREDISDTLLNGYQGIATIEPVADMEQNLKKFMDSRLDMVAYEEAAWHKMVEKNGISPEEFETVYLLREVPIYYAFHKDTPPPLVTRFQEALDRIKARPEYQTILDTYLN